MRCWLVILGYLLFVFFPFSEASALSVTLVNRTGSTIVEAYVSKTPSVWSEDVLKEGAILANERLRLTVPGEAGVYHLRALDEGGGEYLLSDRNLKDGTTVVIAAADSLKSGRTQGYSARILNNTGKAIHRILLQPEGAPKGPRGEDLLSDKEVLLQGEDHLILIPARLGKKIITIQLIDEEGSSYIKTDVDVSREGKVFFTRKDKRN